MKEGMLEKLSGAKKGKAKGKEKWQKRYFVLSNDDLDGDGTPDLGMYYYKTKEAFEKRGKPLGYVVLAKVEIKVAKRTHPKYNNGEEYDALTLSSPTHDIVLRDDPDDGDDDVTDWIAPLERIIEMQKSGMGMGSMGVAEAASDEDAPDTDSVAGDVGSPALVLPGSSKSAEEVTNSTTLPPPPVKEPVSSGEELSALLQAEKDSPDYA